MSHPVKQMVITVASPETINGREGRRELAAFYGELLGMQVVDDGWLRIARDKTSTLQLALDSDGWSDQRPPRWGDPEHPQQMHLDIGVGDIGAADELVLKLGASKLQDNGEHRVYADPAGHPLCLSADASLAADAVAVVRRLVFDCFSPRALARFYEGLLGIDRRVEDTPERVVVAVGDERYPDLAFQHAVFVACRWPDPAHPAQMHVDWRFDDGREAAIERAERLGAVLLPKLADTAIYADPAGHPFCL